MRLLEFLQSRKDEARRIFGERELKIIEKLIIFLPAMVYFLIMNVYLKTLL